MIDLVGKILKVFADNSLFEEGVELIGSWCFQLYKKHLGAKEFPLRTQDIDFLVPNPYHGKDTYISVYDKDMRVMNSFNRLEVSKPIIDKLEKEYLGYPRFAVPN